MTMQFLHPHRRSAAYHLVCAIIRTTASARVLSSSKPEQPQARRIVMDPSKDKSDDLNQSMQDLEPDDIADQDGDGSDMDGDGPDQDGPDTDQPYTPPPFPLPPPPPPPPPPGSGFNAPPVPVAGGTVPLPYTPPPTPPPPETIIRPPYPTDTNKPPVNPLTDEPIGDNDHTESGEHETNPMQGETPIENAE
jgi:hypothetical protein